MFLTSNPDGTNLFVSDNGNGTVTAFDVKGRLIFRFNRLAVVHPLGITADRYNNVYVACGSKVIQIKAGGGEYKKILKVSDQDKIVSVCMDQNTNTLFTISEWGKVSSFEFGHIDSTGHDQKS
jgi:DNA-binding beta-propeller fold protein YncE